MKTIYAVFGDPVEHSMSPVMHNAAFLALGMDCEYHKFRVTQTNLKHAIMGAKAMGFGGLNLTIPLKETALDIVEADSVAEEIGAVNTVEFSGEALIGHNTDGIGALNALKHSGVIIPKSNVLIVGAGGAARAVAFLLAQNGAHITIANRTASRARALAEAVSAVGEAKGTGLDALPELISRSNTVINTTSVGMYPNNNQTLVTSDMIYPGQVIFDLVYNPIKTRLLEEAEKAGAITIDGVKMLVLQGAQSFKIWTGVNPPVDVMERSVKDELKRR
jgi:shikimate dehydrogenase